MKITYPNFAGKALSLTDSYCFTHVGNDPSKRRYSFFLAVCNRVRTYRHAGNDVRGAKGDRLVAAASGVVRHMNWGRALGMRQFTIVDAYGRGFYYAHTLDRPRDGARVREGQFVAHLGDSSYPPVRPHLHYMQFRRWSDKNSSFDPHPYLMTAKG